MNQIYCFKMKFVSCLLFPFLLQMYNTNKIHTPQHIRRIPTQKTGRTWYIVNPASTKSLHQIQPFTDKSPKNLGIGSPSQTFFVQFDTGIKDSWIFSNEYYPSDPNYAVVKNKHTLYNKNASTTYKLPDKKPIPALFKNPQGWQFGFRESDNFHMLGKSINVTFHGIVKAHDEIARGKYDGVVGLRYDVDNGNLISKLCEAKQKSHDLFAVYYRRIYDTELDSGVLTICNLEVSRYQVKTMHWVKEVEGQYGSWKIPIENARLYDSRGNVTLRSNFIASLDTGSEYILAPEADIKLLHTQLRPYFLGDPATSQFDCEKVLLFPNIILTIRGKEYNLTGFDYTLETQYGTEKNCTLILTKGAKANEWSLGAPFLRQYYTVFVWVTNTVGFAEPIRGRLPFDT